jgi:hypothetical protein
MSEFHHGQYLQTSITRPSLEEWEDDSGSTPSHITGLLFELEQVRQDDSAIEYALSAGLAPKFANQALEPFDLLDPRSGHGLSLTGRVGFRPKFFESMAYGVVGSWDEINVDTPAIPLPTDLRRIDQMTAGVFANYQRDKLRLIASVVYFNNELHFFGSKTRDEFTLAYLQPEYELGNEVTIFGRVDAGIDEDNSIFLRMLPAFVSHRNMIGIRWDFADFQALTFEAADTSRQGAGDSHLHRKELRLQWSGVFP